MDIIRRINGILYRYVEQIYSQYGIKLSRFYLIEGEIETLLKNELRECYKDAKEVDAKYSEKEFEAWYNYKYKNN